MQVDSAKEILKRQIRGQIEAIQALVDELPESEERTLAQLDAVKEKVREMRNIEEGRSPKPAEEEPYLGSD